MTHTARAALADVIRRRYLGVERPRQSASAQFIFFSTAMRILFEHMMDALAPIEDVMGSGWFRPAKDDGKPTRAQRIIHAIQGGLSECFVTAKLSVSQRVFHVWSSTHADCVLVMLIEATRP